MVENPFVWGLVAIFSGVVSGVASSLILNGIKGEEKKVPYNTFNVFVNGLEKRIKDLEVNVDKRLHSIEFRISRIEEILMKGGDEE